MTRSPLFYPLNRGGENEVGGAADLQTDVMRFMAILSLCLVAIFALVQSMPLAPSPEIDQVTDSQKVSAESAPTNQKPAADDIAVMEIELKRPRPSVMPPRETPVELQRPQPMTPVDVTPAPAEETLADPVSVVEPVEEGFSLQFETDAALKRLVARRVVGFYAMTGQETLRMSIDGTEISFWPASTPAQFHEMELATVPYDVVRAISRSVSTTGIKWGVTLTPDMSRSLTHYLNTEKGGALVIAGNGRIDLRH